MTPSHRSWGELRPRTRAFVVVSAVIQIGLLAAAQSDIRRRRPEQLNGPKWLWVTVSFVNFVGPITYFAVGRRRTSAA